MIVVVAGTIAVTVLGLFRLGARPLWQDEAVTAGLALGSRSVLWTGLKEDGGGQALYYLCVRAIGFLGNSPWVLRLPSVVATAAMVYPVWRLAERKLGSRTANWSVVFLVTMYGIVTNAQEARVYSLLASIFCWLWLRLDLAMESDRGRDWAICGVLTVLALYSHSLSGLVLVALAIWFLIDKRGRLTRNVLVTGALVAIAAVPLAYLVLFTAVDHTAWAGTFTPRGLIEYVLGAAGARRATSQPILTALASGSLLGLVGLAVLSARKQDTRRAITPFLLWLAVPILITVAVSFKRAYFVPRYAVPIMPPVAILAAYGASTIRPRRWLNPQTVVAVVALISLLRVAVGYGEVTLPWDEVEAYVAAEGAADDTVSFVPAYTQTTFQYYVWVRGHETTVGPPMSPSVPWGSPVFPNVEVYPDTMLATPDGSLWVIIAEEGQEGEIDAVLERFPVAMVEIDRQQFGIGTVLRFVPEVGS